jgi:hypothetical protein
MILTMLVLLATARVAQAECAWVLWGEEKTNRMTMPNIDPTPRKRPAAPSTRKPTEAFYTHWVILGAYPTHAACEEGMVGKLDQMSEQQPDYQGSEITFKYDPPKRLGHNVIAKRSEYAGPTSTTIDLQYFRYLCLPDTINPRAGKGE